MTAFPTPLYLLDRWIHDLYADRADGTIKRYRGATSLAVAGMIAFLLHVLGMPVGWLLAVLSVPAGIALGFTFALPLSEQVLLGSDEGSRQRRGRGPEQ